MTPDAARLPCQASTGAEKESGVETADPQGRHTGPAGLGATPQPLLFDGGPEPLPPLALRAWWPACQRWEALP